MIRGTADTHTLIWYLFDNPKLSRVAGDFIDRALGAGDDIVFSAITFIEIVYLIERGRVDADILHRIDQALAQEPSIYEVPIDCGLADFVAKIPKGAIPDLPDRVIAATALSLGVPLLTADRVIRASSVPTIW